MLGVIFDDGIFKVYKRFISKDIVVETTVVFIMASAVVSHGNNRFGWNN